MATDGTNGTASPGENEFLYHIKRTHIPYHKDPTGALQSATVVSTWTSLAAAKAAARHTLQDEGYDKEFFGSWVEDRGDGVIVAAKTQDGEVFEIAIDTAPNGLNLKGNGQGKVQGDLWHVLQTTIYYDKDRSGGSRKIEVEGTYASNAEAEKAARQALLDEDVAKDWFVEYDERKGEEEWEFGEDVYVHAVGPNGENYVVAVVKKP